MTVSETSASTAEQKACKYCASTLPPRAVYCKDCSKFQTLRSVLINALLGGFNLSSMVTLASVLTLCWAFLHDRLLFPRSEMSVSVVRCSSDHVELAVANTGSRPGVIGRGTLQQIVGSSVRAERDLTVANRDKPAQSGDIQQASLIIAPAQSTILQMQIIRKNWPEAMPDKLASMPGPGCTYRIAIDIVDFGESSPSSKPLNPCVCPGA